MYDPDQTFADVKAKVADSMSAVFPIVGGGRIITADKVWVEDNKNTYDLSSQKTARLKGRSWSVPIKASLVMRDEKTNRVIDKKTVHLADLPKVTPRLGMIYDGNEYQATSLLLLRPGVYTRKRADGSLVSEFHTKGKPFKLRLDPTSKKFSLDIGGASPDLYPILSALGIEDRVLEKTWGKEILEANKGGDPKSINRMYRAFTGKNPDSQAEATDYILTRLKNTVLDPEVTGATLSKGYDAITPGALADATGALLGLSRGTRKSDNRDSLVYKKVAAVEDHFAHKIEHSARDIRFKVLNNIRRFDDLGRVMPPSAFQRPINDVFQKSDLVELGDQLNPIAMVSSHTRATVLGEGGLKTEHEATPEMRMVDPSHIGFLDPLHTPEGSKVGLALHLAEGAAKSGEVLTVPVWNIKKDKLEKKSLQELRGAKIVLPDQVKLSKDGVAFTSKKVRVYDVIDGVSPDEISVRSADYAMVAPQQMFSAATNLLPFIQNNSPLRATVASRQLQQALPLVHREPPLVQTGSLGVSNEQRWGRFSAQVAKVPGVVKKVGAEEIVIAGDDGKNHRVSLYHNFPLNDPKSFLDSEPLVKKGDRVKVGDVLSDTNFTKDGVLSVGTQLRVAYIPYKGLNYEDAVVVSESAASKLTSLELQKKGLSLDAGDVVSKRLFQTYFNSALPRDSAEKLDDDGVIRPGEMVKPGDVLVAALRKGKPTTENRMLKKLHKSLVRPYDNISVTWEEDRPGIVTDVVRSGKQVRVFIKSEKPAEIGDKLTNRHGAKGVISAIIPDSSMPATSDGRPAELLLNPVGVPGRINLGQVFETATGKLAEKLGKPQIMESFDGNPDVIASLQDALKKNGIQDKEDLFDPTTGKKLGKVLIGPQYVLKLKHEVEKKRSARAGGVGYQYDRDRVPKGGGPEGAKSLGNLGLYSLLSRGVSANIREMQSWKTDISQSDDVWTAIQAGLTPPAPRPTFAFNKFMGYIKALGIDVKKDGNALTLAPMTDKQIVAETAGEIKDPGKVVRALDPSKPEKGGLFDPEVTGGLDGEKWCFHGATKVLTDRGMLRIQDIVNKKMDVSVLSFSRESGLVYKKIVAYGRRLAPEPLIHIQWETTGHLNGLFRRSHFSGLWCTPGHEIYTADPLKKVAAGDLEIGQGMLALSHSLTGAQEQLVLGTLLGDAWLSKRCGNAAWECSHGSRQRAYLEYKKRILSFFVDTDLRKEERDDDWGKRHVFRIRSIAHPIFTRVHQLCYKNGRKIVSRQWLDRLDARGLAFWFCDDGSGIIIKNKFTIVIATQSFTRAEMNIIVDYFKEVWGLHAVTSQSRKYRQRDMGYMLCFSPNSSKKLATILAPYVTECLQYKLRKDRYSARCSVCGADINPYYSVCDNCVYDHIRRYSTKRSYNASMGRPIEETAVRHRYGSWSQAVLMATGSEPRVYPAVPYEPFSWLSLLGSKTHELLEVEQPGCLMPCPVSCIERKGNKRYFRTGVVYNIEVADNHNYFANGILVGNSRIRMAEPVPNPIFEVGIKKLLSLSAGDYDDLITGRKGVTAKGEVVGADTAKYTGGHAFKRLLDGLDVNSEITSIESKLPDLRKTELSNAYRRLRYLRALRDNGLKPAEAYLTNYLPVLPPSFRPLRTDDAGNIVRDDINDMYRGIGQLSQQLKELGPKLEDTDATKQKLREDLYDGLKALSGIGTYPLKPWRGIMDIIEGKKPTEGGRKGQPKTGFFQSKLLGARQDLTLYSTITPDPTLGLDELGVPRKLAMTTYKPFVVSEIRSMTGISPLKAQQLIKEGDPIADRALERVVEERPIWIKRDPALHKYSVQAYKPKLVPGNNIKLHPLSTNGFSVGPDSLILVKGAQEEVSCNYISDVACHVSGMGIKELEKACSDGSTLKISTPGYKTLSLGEHIGLNDMKAIFVHISHKECYRVATMDGVTTVATSDHSFIVADDNLQFSSATLAKLSEGTLLPRAAKTELPATLHTISLEPYGMDPRSWVRPVLDLNRELGQFIGSYLGNGSILKGSTISLAAKLEQSRLWAQRVNQNAFGRSGWADKGGTSFRLHSAPLARMLSDTCGEGAHNKRLPWFVWFAPKEFKEGVLQGLWMTDGSLSSGANSFTLRLAQTSRLLQEQVALLLTLMGIGNTLREQHRTDRPIPCTEYTVTVSKEGARKFPELFGKKGERLAALVSDTKPTKHKYDFVPFPDSVRCAVTARGRLLAGNGGRQAREERKAFQADYAPRRKIAVNDTSGTYLSRDTAFRIIYWYGPFSDPLLLRWQALVENDSVSWSPITKIESVDRPNLTFDIEVPGDHTFVVGSGRIVHNSADFDGDAMSAFVPISIDAVKEARQGMPSNNLFNPATGRLMYTPTQEMLTGLFLLSLPGSKKAKKFSSLDDAETEVSSGQLNVTDVVTIGGKKTTVGRMRIASALPETMKPWVLDTTTPLDKGFQKKIFEEVGRKHKDDYGVVANKLKDLGFDHAYSSGISLGLEDFTPERGLRDRILAKVEPLVSKLTPGAKIRMYDKATSDMMEALAVKKGKSPDTLWLMAASGVKPGPEQYRQLVLAPMLMKNPDGSIIPSPVKRSYAEGLTLADYWASISGGRQGIIEKVQSVREPGALTKEMVNSTMSEVVMSDDCGTQEGIHLNIDEGLNGRVLAEPLTLGRGTIPAGTVMDQDIVDRIRSHKVKEVVVRSPLRCQHGVGVCAKCYGVMGDGQLPIIGENVGIMSAQTLGERSTQLALKAFHGGGVVPVGKTEPSGLKDQFGRVKQLLEMPQNIPGSAPLVSIENRDGTVEAIREDPAGGHEVIISGVRHYIPQSQGIPIVQYKGKTKPVVPGMKVHRGDPLSTGLVNPHELLPLTGMDKVQRYLSDELYNLYREQGIDRRAVEVVVRSLTNTGKVEDPGDIPGFTRGDTVSLSVANTLNRKTPQGKQMTVEPFLRGVNIMPLEKTEDWLARMNHNRLRDTLVEAAQQGWTSSIHGVHPIPAAVYGAEFGVGKYY